MGSFKNSFLSKHWSMMLLLAIPIGTMVFLRAVGLPDDLAVGLAFIPAIGVYLYSREGVRDRFFGMSAPATAFAIALSSVGFSQGKSGLIYDTLALLGMVGLLVAIGWLLWRLANISGSA